jgi:predicted dehydrogenase
MRIGIMSFAHVHADGYVHNARRSPGVEFIGFSDADGERGKQAASKYNARWFPTHEALLAEKPDGVIVCSENARREARVEIARRPARTCCAKSRLRSRSPTPRRCAMCARQIMSIS